VIDSLLFIVEIQFKRAIIFAYCIVTDQFTKKIKIPQIYH